MVRSYRERMKPISVADLESPFEDEPLDGSDFLFGDIQLVGHGSVTSPTCGLFRGLFLGCDRVKKHDVTTLDGVNHAGNVHISRAIFFSCDKASCPICKPSWATREARSIERRLAEASKHFGQVEHLMISLPMCDYGLDIDVIREKVVKLLKERGIIGGAMLLHGGRYTNSKDARLKGIAKGWRWSPHLHILGYIFGGYRKCRRCPRKWNCDPSCDGVDAKLWKAYQRDGYYVRIFGERVNVFKSARYLLGHATMRANSVRFQIVTWFGCVAYRKMKVTEEMRKAHCPLCHGDLLLLRYKGLKLNTLMLIYGGSCEVPLKEETDWAIEEPVAVWERYVPSVSYDYSED